jgi:type III secretion system OrgA/MxiK family protein
MGMPFNTEAWSQRLERIMLDPLSYIHQRRFRLPDNINTPRQHAVLNEILTSSFSGELADLTLARHSAQYVLLRYWRQLPYVCMLAGAQLLKTDLVWRGRFLRLPAKVRSFMELPLWGSHSQMTGAVGANGLSLASPGFSSRNTDEELFLQVQGSGLLCLLNWQQDAPEALLGRLRLLFPPELDRCFENLRRSILTSELFLLSQAIQYAKSHPDHV